MRFGTAITDDMLNYFGRGDSSEEVALWAERLDEGLELEAFWAKESPFLI